MSFFDRFNGKSVTLLGAGISNIPTAECFLRGGATLTVRDKKTRGALGEAGDRLEAMGAELILGDNYLTGLGGDYILRSPGFRPDIKEIAEAAAGGSVITGEIQLFLENAPCPVIGVTGSDGKSTTTTLIYKLLCEAGCRAYLGGNIGEPLLHRIDDICPGDVVAAELSSFQLMTINAPLESAVIKNVTPNHLNWHTGMDEYIAAKKRILSDCRRAVLNYDDDVCRALGEEYAGEVVWFSRHIINEAFLSAGGYRGVYIRDGVITAFTPEAGEAPMLKVADILLPGEHNHENYATAIAALWGNVLDEKSLAAAARRVALTFGGVPHRLQLVCEKSGVRFYNSSIDSSPSRTAATISTLEMPIHIICGGCDKNIPFEPLADALLSHPTVKTVVLTGATMDKIKKAIVGNARFGDRHFRLLTEPDFRTAVRAAAAQAKPGDAVLLSPACASFDAFDNFERRGECFSETVRAL